MSQEATYIGESGMGSRRVHLAPAAVGATDTADCAYYSRRCSPARILGEVRTSYRNSDDKPES